MSIAAFMVASTYTPVRFLIVLRKLVGLMRGPQLAKHRTAGRGLVILGHVSDDEA